MNICLIRPPALVDIKHFSVNPTPPIGLAYIAGALAAEKHRIVAIDAIGEDPRQYHPLDFTPYLRHRSKEKKLYTHGISFSDIVKRIPNDIAVIGLSCMFSNNWLADKSLIKILRERFPKAILIAGGESITAKPELWMQQAAALDYCVLGEGEETAVELMKCIKNNEDPAKVAGLAYRDRVSNTIIRTERRTRIKNVDQISPPAWKYFPVDNYHKYKIQFSITQSKTFPVLATRGCPYSCTFCSSPQMWGTRYYMRDLRLVVDEIEGLVKKGITNIDLFDLTAIIKKEWIINFAKELIARNIKITWSMPAGTRSEVIDKEVIHYLKLSGCSVVAYAPESGSTRMLKLIKKKVSLPRMLESMREANKASLYVDMNMILALPGERHRDVWHTLWFLLKCSWAGVNEMGFAMFHPYPGSLLFEQLLDENKIDLTSDDFFYETVISSPLKYSEQNNFNSNISARWYRFYYVLAHVLFFASNFILRPKRFVLFVSNVLSKTPESRFQRQFRGVFIKKDERVFQEYYPA